MYIHTDEETRVQLAEGETLVVGAGGHQITIKYLPLKVVADCISTNKDGERVYTGTIILRENV